MLNRQRALACSGVFAEFAEVAHSPPSRQRDNGRCCDQQQRDHRSALSEVITTRPLDCPSALSRSCTTNTSMALAKVSNSAGDQRPASMSSTAYPSAKIAHRILDATPGNF
ncbi:hypothetical protein [Saccharopolyspora sp. NPDC002376]